MSASVRALALPSTEPVDSVAVSSSTGASAPQHCVTFVHRSPMHRISVPSDIGLHRMNTTFGSSSDHFALCLFKAILLSSCESRSSTFGCQCSGWSALAAVLLPLSQRIITTLHSREHYSKSFAN